MYTTFIIHSAKSPSKSCLFPISTLLTLLCASLLLPLFGQIYYLQLKDVTISELPRQGSLSQRLRQLPQDPPPHSIVGMGDCHVIEATTITVKSRFNESWFDVKSWLKVQILVIEMEFHMKKSRFRVKSRFKESKCAYVGHSLNRDFTV